MPIGLGIGLNISMRGGLGGGLSLTAPDAAWISDAATAQAVFEIDVDGTALDTDTVYGEAYTDAGLTSLFDTDEELVDTSDFIISTFAFDPFTPDGTYYVRFCIRRGGIQISPWSDVISMEIDTSTYAGTYYYLGF